MYYKAYLHDLGWVDFDFGYSTRLSARFSWADGKLVELAEQLCEMVEQCVIKNDTT